MANRCGPGRFIGVVARHRSICGEGYRTPATPRSARQWAKATLKSSHDFPETEAASAERRTKASGERTGPKEAAEKELEACQREKENERRHTEQPARAQRDPEWQRKDHLDPERDPHRPSRTDAAKEAEGQAERGIIDQINTSKGYTQRG